MAAESSTPYARAREVIAKARRITIVHHIDLDGIGAAAVVARAARRWGASVKLLPTGARSARRSIVRALRSSGPLGAVVVADLSPGGSGDAASIASALRLGRLVWFDHHAWEEKSRRMLEEAGAVLVLDRRRVTADIACLAVRCRGDPVSEKIVEIALADDSCRPHPLAEKWRIVLRILGPRSAARAAEALASGILWPDWAGEVYEKRAEEYFGRLRGSTRLFRYEFQGVKVAVLVPPPEISGCDLERAGLVPGDVDVAVIAYPRGLSIRTMGGADASCVAGQLGGGGHSEVAGAPRPSLSMGPGQLARMVARAFMACRAEGDGK